MNLLIIGSGGREHALAWKLAQSPRVKKLYCAPSSDAISLLAERVDLNPVDFAGIAQFCAAKAVDIVVVGPETPLAAGIADGLKKRGVPVFGPSQSGALLESSKSRAKEFMFRHGIPTAKSETFTKSAEAKRAVNSASLPVVIKADGLAAGKGVRVCAAREEALEAVEDFMVRRVFGQAGRKVLVEEFMTGREVSAMAFCDGKTCVPMPFARDHKRLLDLDKGPNTGGMGVYSPLPDVDAALAADIQTQVFDRFVKGIREEGIDYRGVIYAGLMITAAGPKVVEFNCRFGDPETQAVLPLLESDLAEIIAACVEGRLSPELVRVSPGASACVVLASAGYPELPESGKPVFGLDKLEGLPGVTAFHAGTKKTPQTWITSGGRVLAISAQGADLPDAVNRAYEAASRVRFEGMHYRRDIGKTL